MAMKLTIRQTFLKCIKNTKLWNCENVNTTVSDNDS